jgi:hypothetical protein
MSPLIEYQARPVVSLVTNSMSRTGSTHVGQGFSGGRVRPVGLYGGKVANQAGPHPKVVSGQYSFTLVSRQ